EDEYRRNLQQIIEARAKNETVSFAEQREPEATPVIDLVARLKESLQQTRGNARASGGSSSSPGGGSPSGGSSPAKGTSRRAACRGGTHGKAAAKSGTRKSAQKSSQRRSAWRSRMPAARALAVPSPLEPMLASTGSHEIGTRGWIYEPKWDGVRILLLADRDRVRLLTRNGNDKASQFPEVVDAALALVAGRDRGVVLDGELVALDAS